MGDTRKLSYELEMNGSKAADDIEQIQDSLDQVEESMEQVEAKSKKTMGALSNLGASGIGAAKQIGAGMRSDVSGAMQFSENRSKSFTKTVVTGAKNIGQAFLHPVKTIRKHLVDALADAEDGVDDLGTKAGHAGRDMENMGAQGAGSLGKIIKGAAGAAIALKALKVIGKVVGDFVSDSWEVAQNAETIQARFNKLFDGTDAEEWAENFATATRSSFLKTKTWLSDNMNLFEILGYSKDDSLELSKITTSLGKDLSAAFAIDEDTAMSALRDALTGNLDTLNSYGLGIDSIVMKQTALRLGYEEDLEKLSEAQFADVALVSILEKTADEQRKGADELDGLFQASSRQASSWENLKARVGEETAPIAIFFRNLSSDIADTGLALFDAFDTLKVKWDTFTSNLSSNWETFAEDWATFGSLLRTGWDGFWDNVGTGWDTFTTNLETGWTTFTGNLRTGWDGFWDNLGTGWDTFSANLSTGWSTFTTNLRTGWDNFWDNPGAAWDTFAGNLETKWSTFTGNLRTGWDGFWDNLGTGWDTFSTNLSTGWSTFTSSLRSGWDGFWNNLGTGWDTFATKLETKWSTFTTNLRTGWDEFWAEEYVSPGMPPGTEVLNENDPAVQEALFKQNGHYPGETSGLIPRITEEVFDEGGYIDLAKLAANNAEVLHSQEVIDEAFNLSADRFNTAVDDTSYSAGVFNANLDLLAENVGVAAEGFAGVIPLLSVTGGGAPLPPIPGNARGTDNFIGGWTRMNEEGGELAYLPGGTAIIPADKTDRILDGSSGGGITIMIQNTIQGNADAETVQELNDTLEETVRRVLRELQDDQNIRLTIQNALT